jgi:hypothetical protein
VIGDQPLTVGSKRRWEFTVTKDGAVWDLTGVPVSLWWHKPNGTLTTASASGDAQGKITVTDTASVLDAPGAWAVAADVTGFGRTPAVGFVVVASP